MEEIKFINVNDQQVVDLVPDYDRKLAIVDFDVLNRLTRYLPVQDLSYFKINLKKSITNSHSLDDIVKVCEDFTAFHRSVNLIQEVYTELESQNACEDLEPEEAEPELNPYE